ncbi:MAG: molybdopterin converting factor subunit 1 [Alteromonadaceae bacterium]|nr:molybdopterin converting factor subunit 1 [Alteromonadaceae bacterium]
MIKIVFFAALREQLDCAELTVPAADIATINQLKQVLVGLNPLWQTYFENKALLSAVNHDMVDGEHSIKSGDEVAFFPPVTGG